MNKFLFLIKLLLAASFFTFIASCSDDDDIEPTPQEQTIANIAAGDAQFSTLVSALDRVGLVSVLNGSGNFTVFAPTNDAFTALGIDLATVSDEALTEILLYHVVGAEIFAGDIADGQTYVASQAATGPNGTNLSLLVEKGANGVEINGSSVVTAADIDATNGVIHVVNRVLTPLDIVGHAVANTNFTSLVGALSTADGDLVNVLSGDGPFTVFAPVNSAFEELADVAATLTTGQLSRVLTYHVTSGNVRSTALTNNMDVATVNGENFTVDLSGANPTIIDANGSISTIVLLDVQTTNGVIHVLDRVIIPANL